MRRFGPTIALSCTLGLLGGAAAADDGGMFIIHALDQPPAEAAALVRAHAEAEEDWLFLAQFDLAGGSVTALKICYPEIGPDIVAAGMHTMAMMPCGHLAFYDDNGQSTLSMLHPAFMTELHPHPRMEDAVATVTPAFAEMLSEVLGAD